jgi:hypothetical protein
LVECGGLLGLPPPTFDLLKIKLNQAAAPVEKQLICAVHPGNFPLCYRSVHAFLVQIESQFFRASSTDVLLNTLLGAFLNDYGTNTFFTLVKEDAIRALERIRDGAVNNLIILINFKEK